jgi:hypothetical protein
VSGKRTHVAANTTILSLHNGWIDVSAKQWHVAVTLLIRIGTSRDLKNRRTNFQVSQVSKVTIESNSPERKRKPENQRKRKLENQRRMQE